VLVDPMVAGALDPMASGVQIRIDTQAGNPIYNRVVPRGEGSAKGYPGWTVNSKRTRWTYRDPKGVRSPGVRKVVVENRSNQTPGLLRVSVTASKSAFAVGMADLPLRLTVVLGARDQGALGLCGELAFHPDSGTPPRCRMSTNGSTVSCGS
jgi:hypothetical protein